MTNKPQFGLRFLLAVTMVLAAAMALCRACGWDRLISFAWGLGLVLGLGSIIILLASALAAAHNGLIRDVAAMTRRQRIFNGLLLLWGLTLLAVWLGFFWYLS
jgi:hypothetical protein